MGYSRNQDEDESGGSGFAKLKIGASKLKINLQMYFWTFVGNQAKYLIHNDSSVFYDVLTQSLANPLSSPAMVEAGGGFGVGVRGIRVLLIPIQKLLQYGAWYVANEEYESKYAVQVTALEEIQKQLKEDLLIDLNPEGTARKLKAAQAKAAAIKLEYETRNPNEALGYKKPEFTRRDGLYMLLDVGLLALAIAALVYGATIAGAAIATAAAVIGLGGAVVNFSKYLYDGYKLKQEKNYVDALLKKVDHPGLLNENDKKYINEQREQCEKENPGKNIAGLTDKEILQRRGQVIEASLRQNIENRYQTIRKTLGFTLTMMGVVSASLILGGLLLGPYGVPVIAAGVGLAMVTTAIAVGMMIVNMVKRNRDLKRERQGILPKLVVTDQPENRVDRANQLVNQHLLGDALIENREEPASLAGSPIAANPVPPSGNRQTLFRRNKDATGKNILDIELDEVSEKDKSQNKKR